LVVLLKKFVIIENMKAYYENKRELDEIVHIVSPCCLINAHFHNNLEIFVVNKGEYKITCNGKSSIVSDGQIVVFDSYDIHSYDQRLCRQEQCDDFVLVIPYEYLGQFNALRKNKRIANNVLSDKELCEKLKEVVYYHLNSAQSQEVKSACIQLVLSYIKEKLCFVDDEFVEGKAVRKILDVIHLNYKSGITAGEICLELGYSNAYVSRTFAKYLKQSIPTYINRLRLDCVEELLRENNTIKISDAILEAGFKSFQSYYRNKKRIEKGNFD